MNLKNNIGLGTAAIGRPLYINVKQAANAGKFSLAQFKENGLKVLDEAYVKGIRHFDTAPGYGMAEELVLDWLSEKEDPSMQVSTKWGYTYTANFDPKAKEHEQKEHSLAKLNEQWQRSKKLLPYLKIYQIHSATLDSGVLENTEVLKRLHEIKNDYDLMIGFTTTGANQAEVLEKGLSIEIENERLFDSVQCTFNILDQSILAYAEPLHKLTGPVIIKEALANGRLLPNIKYATYQQLYTLMTSLAKKYNVGTDAIALRFCMDAFADAIVLSGANNNAHLNANLKSSEFELTDVELEQLKGFGVSTADYWNERKKLVWN